MKQLQACLPAFNWKTLAIVGTVLVGLIVCGVPAALISGSVPLLLVACLLPCLLPLILLKNKRQPQITPPLVDEHDPATSI